MLRALRALRGYQTPPEINGFVERPRRASHRVQAIVRHSLPRNSGRQFSQEAPAHDHPCSGIHALVKPSQMLSNSGGVNL